MKVGIYISGLGQSVVNETVEKYAARFMNEMSYYTQGVNYSSRTEVVNYTDERSSTVVSIYEDKDLSKPIYKLYDFHYKELLTGRFNQKPLLFKNLWLLLLVFRKAPQIFKKIFSKKGYNRPIQTFYLFMIFMLIALAVILMIPASISVIENFWDNELATNIKAFFNLEDKNIPFISIQGMQNLSQLIAYATAFLILFVPNANILVADLATEFVCANDYLENGIQRQLIQGNLEKLVDYISENEQDCKIHFHSYSFGSILSIDYLFPYGNNLSKNAEKYCESLITIGSPYDFIQSYYPNFYIERNIGMDGKLKWFNVYSISDALASSFRDDRLKGDAEYGVAASKCKPLNLNYEITAVKEGLLNFILLSSLKAHGVYWDPRVNGQSCLRLILEEMRKNELLPQFKETD